MQRTNWFEIALSALVVLVGAGFLAYILWQTGTRSLGSYDLAVRMTSADGIGPGADVRIAGVKVGEVESVDLVKTGKRYGVDVTLSIRDDIRLPDDSRLSVGGGTLSSTALVIAPGRSKTLVPPGGTLKAG